MRIALVRADCRFADSVFGPIPCGRPLITCCLVPAGAENEVEISLAVRAGANVVQVYGFCFDAPDGKLRIVMELCAHGSLRAHLKALPRDKVFASTRRL